MGSHPQKVRQGDVEANIIDGDASDEEENPLSLRVNYSHEANHYESVGVGDNILNNLCRGNVSQRVDFMERNNYVNMAQHSSSDEPMSLHNNLLTSGKTSQESPGSYIIPRRPSSRAGRETSELLTRTSNLIERELGAMRESNRSLTANVEMALHATRDHSVRSNNILSQGKKNELLNQQYMLTIHDLQEKVYTRLDSLTGLVPMVMEIRRRADDAVKIGGVILCVLLFVGALILADLVIRYNSV